MTGLNTCLYKNIGLLILVFNLNSLQAQVPVHQEPRHHLVFQNKEIRILNVLIPPGDTSQYHLHHTPSLFILFTSTANGAQLLGGKASSGASVAGSIYFENLAPPHTRIHRVWNEDKDSFHVMDIEMLSEDTGFIRPPLSLPGLSLLVDTPQVRAYRLRLLNGDWFKLSHKNQSFVLVSLGTSVIQTKKRKTADQTLKPGSFFIINKGRSFFLRNTGKEPGVFCLVEWPVQ